jgi:hypothetical protein
MASLSLRSTSRATLRRARSGRSALHCGASDCSAQVFLKARHGGGAGAQDGCSSNIPTPICIKADRASFAQTKDVVLFSITRLRRWMETRTKVKRALFHRDHCSSASGGPRRIRFDRGSVHGGERRSGRAVEGRILAYFIFFFSLDGKWKRIPLFVFLFFSLHGISTVCWTSLSVSRW